VSHGMRAETSQQYH